MDKNNSNNIDEGDNAERILSNEERTFYKIFEYDIKRLESLKQGLENKKENNYFDISHNDNGDIQISLKEQYRADGDKLKLQYVDKSEFIDGDGYLLENVINNSGSLKMEYRKKMFFTSVGRLNVDNSEYFEKDGDTYKLKNNLIGKSDEALYYFDNDGYLKDQFKDYAKSTGNIIYLKEGELKYQNNKELIDTYFNNEDWNLREEYRDGYIVSNGIRRYKLKEEHRGDKNINKYYNVNSERNNKLSINYKPSILNYININGELKNPYKDKLINGNNDDTFNYFDKIEFVDHDGSVKKLSSIFYRKENGKKVKNDVNFEVDDKNTVVYKPEKLLGNLYYKDDYKQFIQNTENSIKESEEKMRRSSLYTMETDVLLNGEKVPVKYSFSNHPYQAYLKKGDFIKNYGTLLTAYVDSKYPREELLRNPQLAREKQELINIYGTKLSQAINNEFIFSKDLSGIINHIEKKMSENENYEIPEEEIKTILDASVEPVNGRITLQKIVMQYHSSLFDSNDNEGKFKRKFLFNNNGDLEPSFKDEDGNLKKEYRPKKYFNGLGELNDDLRDTDGNLKKQFRPKKYFEKDSEGQYKYLVKDENGKLKKKTIQDEGLNQDEKNRLEMEISELFDENGYVKDEYFDKNVNDLKEIYRDSELSTLYNYDGVLKDEFKDSNNNRLKTEYNDPLVRKYYNTDGELKAEKIILKNNLEIFSGINKFVDIDNGNVDMNKIKKYFNNNIDKIEDIKYDNLKPEYKDSPISNLLFNKENHEINDNLLKRNGNVYKLKTDVYDDFRNSMRIDIKEYNKEYNNAQGEILTDLGNMLMHILKTEDYNNISQSEFLIDDEPGFNEMVENLIKNYPNDGKIKQLDIEYKKRKNCHNLRKKGKKC
ncbi:hypothetical protein PIROE2DRAFT_1759 [Piromyces sp. E2]|nr:hypothetical protein PIROE2DRAFT_1759 [Piromyces sp. E2]|eukprot:OUM70082.1 hypothetical protein PIROE2DRAFT_1759 [Piromyces sp. E2]